MTLKRRLLFVAAVVSLIAVALILSRAQAVPDTLPTELSDRAFWQMVVDFSEPDGLFRSDNFVSNERTYQEVIPELKLRALPNGVYLFGSQRLWFRNPDVDSSGVSGFYQFGANNSDALRARFCGFCEATQNQSG